MGKWSNLPLDLLCLIEDYAALYIDKVRLRAVSQEWNSCLPKLPDYRAEEIHFLLHPLVNNEEDDATHGLYNPLDKKVYKLYVPELTAKLFSGSSYGWIVVTGNTDTCFDEICLINPLTRAQIKLPPRTEFSDFSSAWAGKVDGKVDMRKVIRSIMRSICSDDELYHFYEMFTMKYCLRKIILSSDASNDECVVIAIFGGKIAWCKCDDRKWTCVHTADDFSFVDILYLKSYLYGLTYKGRVIVFENIGTELEIKFKEINRVTIPIKCSYMAECSDGSLIVAARYLVDDSREDPTMICAEEFRVYKLFSTQNSSFAEVKSIGDDVLFVGFGPVRSLPSKNLSGFKKNHIYYCDFARLATDKDDKNVQPNIHVFSLEDRTVKPLRILGDFTWPRPIWMNIGNGDHHIRPLPMFNPTKLSEKMVKQERTNVGGKRFRDSTLTRGVNRKRCLQLREGIQAYHINRVKRLRPWLIQKEKEV